MAGTRANGGMLTVVQGYEAGGLFDRFDIRFITTHWDGSVSLRAKTAANAYLTLCRLLVTAREPLVHVHMSSRGSFWRKSVICALARLRGRPYVIHMHGSEFRKFYHEECGRFAKWAVRNVFEKSAVVLALSGQWNDELKRIAPRATVQTFPNAVRLYDAPKLAPANGPVRILFAGRIGARKGTFELLKAFARIAPRFPAATLVCAGDGDAEQLMAVARQLGVAGQVECPGWLSPQQLGDQLSRASIFALPSHAEGVPMAVLEAMARSLPVLTTPVGGIPEVIQDDRNGLMVSPGDVDAIERALVRLLESPELRERLGAAARETIARNYSLDSAIERVAALYRRFGIPDRAAPEPRST
jgi:glycosyltransferase involved in cell wall biosynthesis